ncbi:PD-(D/E)XK nuclease family protein [Candidatus Margulisiibacteriota bacterium]
MSIYSEESLEVYEQCPLWYKYKYVDGIRRSVRSMEVFLKEIFQEIIHNIYVESRNEKVSLPIVRDHYLALWTKKYKKVNIKADPEKKPAHYLDLGQKGISNYLKRYRPFVQKSVLGVDKKIMVDLDGKGKYIVEGSIDVLVKASDGVYEIHENKLEEDIPEQEYFNKDRKLVLSQLGLQKMLPEAKRVSLVWYYPAKDKLYTRFIDKQQLLKTKKDSIEIIERIAQEKYYFPDECPVCVDCVYDDLCPKRKNFFNLKSMLVRDGFQERSKMLELD